MSRFIFFNEQGHPTGIGVYVVPQDAVDQGGYPIPDSQLTDKELLERSYLHNGELRFRDPQPSPYHYWDNQTLSWIEDLERLREDSLQQVDRWAEMARLKLITPGSGQAMAYQAKLKEAEAIRDGVDISTPWLSAEAELMGLTLEQMAQKILQAKEEWEQAAIALECQRLKAKNDIRNAAESSEIYGIIEQVKKQFQM